MRIPGDIDRERAAELEEAIWDRLHFATHLRSQRLGEFTVGTELHRSESLALVQLLILYHVVTARAAIALGGSGTRAGRSVHPVAAAAAPNA
jgi:phosphoribulokinase